MKNVTFYQLRFAFLATLALGFLSCEKESTAQLQDEVPSAAVSELSEFRVIKVNGEVTKDVRRVSRIVDQAHLSCFDYERKELCVFLTPEDYAKAVSTDPEWRSFEASWQHPEPEERSQESTLRAVNNVHHKQYDYPNHGTATLIHLNLSTTYNFGSIGSSLNTGNTNISTLKMTNVSNNVTSESVRLKNMISYNNQSILHNTSHKTNYQFKFWANTSYSGNSKVLRIPKNSRLTLTTINSFPDGNPANSVQRSTY